MQQTGSAAFTEGGASPTKKPKKKSAKNEDLNAAYGATGETVTKKKSKKKSARSESRPNENEFEVNLEEPQKNKFDTIWDADQLAPKVADGQLGTIGEEFAPLKITRTKSYLGGKVAKLDDEHISNLSSVEDANKPITYKKVKSANKPDQNTNDDAVLVDEFNKAQSSSSSIGGVM